MQRSKRIIKRIGISLFSQTSRPSITPLATTKIVKKIKGVQLLGDVIELKGHDLEKATKQYLKAFPYARLMKLQLWEMELNFVKMTLFCVLF